jgi:hypothetical protein
MSESIGVIYFAKKGRAATLKPGLELDKIKRLKTVSSTESSG